MKIINVKIKMKNFKKSKITILVNVNSLRRKNLQEYHII